VDRSGDALKHANHTGIGKTGGVVAVVGDDPSCKSSSLCSQSEPMLFDIGAVVVSRRRSGDARLQHVLERKQSGSEQ
jgi:TPP-dependent indolepyruvate ferredoxin oxidoreductase alpha subunit